MPRQRVPRSGQSSYDLLGAQSSLCHLNSEKKGHVFVVTLVNRQPRKTYDQSEHPKRACLVES